MVKQYKEDLKSNYRHEVRGGNSINTASQIRDSSPPGTFFNKDKVAKEFSYIAGLWEGDGHIVLSSLCFAITFNNKNKKLCLELVNKYGGNLRDKKKENAIVWQVTDQKGVLKIIKNIINYLRTPKKVKLLIVVGIIQEKLKNKGYKLNKVWYRESRASTLALEEGRASALSLEKGNYSTIEEWAKYVNGDKISIQDEYIKCLNELIEQQNLIDNLYILYKKKYFINETVFLKLPDLKCDISNLNSNSWLAGFIDADGSFGINYREKKIDNKTGKILTKRRSSLRFRLEQRLEDPFTKLSYKPIMEKISLEFFNLEKLNYSKHNGKIYFIVEVSGLLKIDILVNYLNIYNLKTIKKYDFYDWIKVRNLILDKSHLTIKGRKLIKELKLNMNRNRRLNDPSLKI